MEKKTKKITIKGGVNPKEYSKAKAPKGNDGVLRMSSKDKQESLDKIERIFEARGDGIVIVVNKKGNEKGDRIATIHNNRFTFQDMRLLITELIKVVDPNFAALQEKMSRELNGIIKDVESAIEKEEKKLATKKGKKK